MRTRDMEFLSSYGELGVYSRRVLAETALRALALASPPQRKVLGMHIMEQYVLAAGDLIALYNALLQRGREPMMKAFLEARLDRTAALAFFNEMATRPQSEMMAALGLPMPDEIARACPSLSKEDARDLGKAVTQMLGDLKRAGGLGESAALALADASGERRGGAALLQQSTWLDNVGLRPDQVASVTIDDRRRTINITAISVDEKRMQNVISAIDAMTNASANLVYATLTMEQERARASAKAPRAKRAR